MKTYPIQKQINHCTKTVYIGLQDTPVKIDVIDWSKDDSGYRTTISVSTPKDQTLYTSFCFPQRDDCDKREYTWGMTTLDVINTIECPVALCGDWVIAIDAIEKFIYLACRAKIMWDVTPRSARRRPPIGPEEDDKSSVMAWTASQLVNQPIRMDSIAHFTTYVEALGEQIAADGQRLLQQYMDKVSTLVDSITDLSKRK